MSRIAPAIAASLALSATVLAGTSGSPGVCHDAAVARAARLLAELPRASVERQRAIGPEVRLALGSAASDPACWARAFDRARALLAGASTTTALDPGTALDRAKEAATLARLRAVRVALLAYQAERDTIPSTEEGIGSMVEAGILRREDILDAWGRVLIYRRATSDPREFELSSAGPDGKPHTPDDVSLPYL